MPRFGASSPAAGQDCFTFWFHQDFAADADQLLIPEQFAKLDEIYSMCTVVHIFVGHEPYDKDIMSYASALMPGLQSKVAKDPDMSGVFFAKELADLGQSEFVQAVYKYVTLVKSRASCRLYEDGFIPHPPVEPSEGSLGISLAPGEMTTEFPTEQPTAASLLTVTQPPPTDGFRGVGFETVAPTVGDAMEYAGATVAPRVPEVDSCCGHDMFSGVPYDSELRTCCEDGTPRQFVNDGTDPCEAGILDYWSF